MKNIIIIAKREFLTQVKKKSFFILTLLAPLLAIAFGGVVGYIFQANKTSYTINVADKSGTFTGKLLSNEEIKYQFVNPNSAEQLKSALKDMPDTDGLLVIAPFQGDFEVLQKETLLFVNKKIGYEIQQSIVADLSKVLKEEKIKQLGISENEIKNLDKNFNLDIQNIVDGNEADTGLSFGIKSALSMVLMYMVFMFIIIYGVRVMRSVLEEKNNRVVEIIISSVKPFELMMGKIIGVTGVALTQFSIWIAMALVSLLFLNQSFPTGNQLPTSPVLEEMNLQEMVGEVLQIVWGMNLAYIFIVFLLFFIIGYLFYSSIYSAIGSAVDNETETQQFTFIALAPLMVAVYGSFGIISNPEGPMAFWLSMVPFTSPVVMVARMPFGVPLWEVLLSLAVLVCSMLFMVYVASKIYRIGILMRGNKASLKEIWKWIKE